MTKKLTQILLGIALTQFPLKYAGAQNAPQAPAPQQTTSAGCASGPVKPPKAKVPPKLQRLINKHLKKIADNTGIEIDPNTPGEVLKDAQTAKPCTPAPAGQTPPPAPSAAPPAKQ